MGPQLYNSEALPFTYDHYVVIKLADKLYNSVTVCFYALQKYVFHIGQNWMWTRRTAALIVAQRPQRQLFLIFVWVHEFSSR